MNPEGLWGSPEEAVIVTIYTVIVATDGNLLQYPRDTTEHQTMHLCEYRTSNMVTRHRMSV